MILAIDQARPAQVPRVRSRGRADGRAYREFEQHFPRPGWVAHDAGEIWTVTRPSPKSIDDAGLYPVSSKQSASPPAETVLLWDPSDGPASPRDRLAGPQRRCTLRRAGEGGTRAVGARGPGSCSTRTLRDEIEWCWRTSRLADRARDGRRCSGRSTAWLIFKLTGELATDRRRLPNPAVDIRGVPGTASCSTCSACPGACRRWRVERRDRRDPRRGSTATRYRWRGRGRPAAALFGQAHRSGLARTRTGRGRSSPERGFEAPEPATAAETVAWRIGTGVCVRARARSSSRGRRHGCADGLGIISAAAGPGCSRARSRATTASTSCCPDGLGSPHGTICPRHDRRADRARVGLTSRAPRSRRSPTRRLTRCADGTGVRGCRWRSCAPRRCDVNDWLMHSSPTCSGSR